MKYTFHCCVRKIPLLVYISRQSLPSCFVQIHFNIILPSAARFYTWFLSLGFVCNLHVLFYPIRCLFLSTFNLSCLSTHGIIIVQKRSTPHKFHSLLKVSCIARSQYTSTVLNYKTVPTEIHITQDYHKQINSVFISTQLN